MNIKRYIVLVCMALMVGVGVPVSVQAESAIITQKKFLTNAVQTFLQRANAVQRIIQKRTDIFTQDIQDELLDKSNESIVAFTGYLNDVESAQTVDELRTLAGVIYTYRTTEDTILRHKILSAYVMYFEKTTQQLIISRYQNVQNKIVSAKNQGRDTSSIEIVFAHATSALKRLQDIITTLHKSLQDQEGEEVVFVSLDKIEKGLVDIQEQVTSLYSTFRKISIQGDTVLELDTEERNIRNALPSW